MSMRKTRRNYSNRGDDFEQDAAQKSHREADKGDSL
jgi:hypothetical protein